MINRLFRSIVIFVLATVLFACGTSQVPAPTFSRDDAIQRATLTARHSAPEVGILEARVDSATAELITLVEADRRMGGERSPGGYASGQTPETLVWWVIVRGYFKYEGMQIPPNAVPICEADERDFTYDAQTGESTSQRILNTRCAPFGMPDETDTPPATITPIAIPRTFHDELELALGKAQLPDRKMLCEWEVLGETPSEIYVCFFCVSEMQPGPAGIGQAVVRITPNGQVQSVQQPRDGSLWSKDVQVLFPPQVQVRIRSFDYDSLATRLSIRRTRATAAETVTPSPTDYGYPPWVGTPALGNPPRSNLPLPVGVANGDVLDSGNLLWFVWENTKSRIWFPNGDAYLDRFRQGPDKTGRLRGVTTIPYQWEIVIRTTPDHKQIQQVYLADRISHVIYPLKHQVLPWDQAEKIPTALVGGQYSPILSEK